MKTNDDLSHSALAEGLLLDRNLEAGPLTWVFPKAQAYIESGQWKICTKDPVVQHRDKNSLRQISLPNSGSQSISKSLIAFTLLPSPPPPPKGPITETMSGRTSQPLKSQCHPETNLYLTTYSNKLDEQEHHMCILGFVCQGNLPGWGNGNSEKLSKHRGPQPPGSNISLMIWGGADIITIKCTINAMHLNHP